MAKSKRKRVTYINSADLILPKVLNGFVRQFTHIVSSLPAQNIDSPHQQALLEWVDKVVKQILKNVLDSHGYLKARVADEIGWSHDETLYQAENIQAITFSFLKNVIDVIIKQAFPQEEQEPNLIAAILLVNDFALRELKKNHCVKPMRCKDFSKCISKEFDKTPIEMRIPADYMVLRWLLDQLRDKKNIPESELLSILSTAYSRCNHAGILLTIMQKYYELADFSKGRLG